MKKFLFVLTNLLTLVAFTQTGPGGIGNSSDNIVWLDAARLGLSNNTPVSSWTDFSGNNNHAAQAIGAQQPIFKTNQLNGVSAVDFDGTDDFLQFTNHITTGAISAYTIHQSQSTAINGVMTLEKHMVYTSGGFIANAYDSPRQYYSFSFNQNDPTIFQFHTSSATSGVNLNSSRSNSSTTAGKNSTRTAFLNKTVSSVGSLINGLGNPVRFQNGEISEIIVFNRELSLAEKNIVNSYLGGKYGISSISIFYSFTAAFGDDVFGIGRESDGANTTAQGTGIIEISNATSLGNGDYLIIGHNGNDLTTSTAVGNTFSTNRYNRIWRVDVTNTPGDIDLVIDVSGNNFAANPATDYKLLIDNASGTFDNAGIDRAITGGVYDAINETITFNGVTLNDGEFFTLGDASSIITSTATGNWTDASTWSCACVPTATDAVILAAPFTVSVNGAGATAEEVIIQSGATLSFSADQSLAITGDLTNDGSINMPSAGKLLFNGTAEQEVVNNSADAINIWNIEVDNSNDVRLTAGSFEITNFAKVTSGQLINDGAVATFVSDASFHSQIEASTTNGFSGRFIMQRFFTSRIANYADITTPTVSTTIGDWDQELFMSGVGGADGDATDGPGGPVQQTVWKYNNAGQSWVAVTDTNTTITAGEPIEMFLGDNLTTFSAQTMDSRGTPFTGPRSFNLSAGFNFIGNPYRSFINYTSVPKPAGMNNQFYIYQQSTGAYTLFTGGFIAAEQGFWVSSPGSRTITFNESNKFPLNFNQILRQKRDPRFELKITSLENNYGNSISLLPTNNEADDAAYLPSPEKTTPAITLSKNGNKLIQQSLNTTVQQMVLPLDLYAGIDGSYVLSTNDFAELAGVYNCLILEDKLENKFIDLSENTTYTFSSLKGDYERFNLHLIKSAADCDKLLRNTNASSSSAETLYLTQRGHIIELNYQLEEGTQAQIDVLALNGQKVLPTSEISISGNGKQIISDDTNLNGIYLIVVRTDHKVITEKFRFN